MYTKSRDDWSDGDFESGLLEMFEFPEVENLPKEAKLPISQFLKEHLSDLIQGNEPIPFEVQLLDLSATVELEDKGDGGVDASGQGPYGTILHTASAIGNLLLIKLQIQAGVDVNTLDDHNWTAKMVAKAQGHDDCAKLLPKQEELDLVNTWLPPSGLVSSTSNPILQIGPDQLTAAVSTLDFSPVVDGLQIRANHPIPPNCEAFYYEMKIEESGPFG